MEAEFRGGHTARAKSLVEWLGMLVALEGTAQAWYRSAELLAAAVTALKNKGRGASEAQSSRKEQNDTASAMK